MEKNWLKAFAQDLDEAASTIDKLDNETTLHQMAPSPSEHDIDTNEDVIPERLGSSDVRIDLSACNGEVRLDDENLSMESLSNFCSARTNACVISGSWQYEVVLGTAGIQQVGWATPTCPFTNEEGVGDFPDSYAYDGKRVRKWNVSCHPYGQPWMPGDVVGCCFNVDEGEISFYR